MGLTASVFPFPFEGMQPQRTFSFCGVGVFSLGKFPPPTLSFSLSPFFLPPHPPRNESLMFFKKSFSLRSPQVSFKQINNKKTGAMPLLE